MARYDITIELHQTHSFAIEADDPSTAQVMAMAQLGNRPAEHSLLTVSVDQGVN